MIVYNTFSDFLFIKESAVAASVLDLNSTIFIPFDDKLKPADVTDNLLWKLVICYNDIIFRSSANLNNGVDVLD